MVSIRNNLKENPQTSPSRSARSPACGRASLPACPRLPAGRGRHGRRAGRLEFYPKSIADFGWRSIEKNVHFGNNF